MFKNFYIKDLFDVINNPQLDKRNFIFSESAEYPYFTRTENNNGILGYVEYLDEEHKIPGNSLAVGMISMKFHYMQHDFYAGQFTKTLIPKFQGFNEKTAMYFTTILNKYSEYYQSSLVRHFKDKVSETVVSLPVIESPDPDHEYTIDDIDFEYMQERIAELEQERIAELDAYLAASGLDDYELTDEDKEILSLSPESAPDKVGTSEADFGNGQKFKKLRIGDIFSWMNGNVDLKKEHVNGRGYPLISSGLANMGIIGRTDAEARIIPADTITVDMFGNAFYRDFEYKEVTHARVFTLVPNGFHLNRKTGLYIVSSLSFLSKEFSYNNMCSYAKIESEKVILPVIESSDPNHEYTADDIDFGYMERYIRAIEKLAIADVVKYKDKLIETTKQIAGA